MSLREFQRAIADFIASPERCARAMTGFAAETADFDLTERERRRLKAMVSDRRMSANCTLFRVNRLVPIFEVLPLTWRHLGAAAEKELHEFWRQHPDAVVQYGEEASRFGAWLEGRLSAGALPPGPAFDALRFELAAFDLAVTAETPLPGSATAAQRRVVRFDYDHMAVLRPAPGPVTPRRLRKTRWILLEVNDGGLCVSQMG
jgi:hypothetical protein